MKKKINKINLILLGLLIIFAGTLLLDFTGLFWGDKVTITVENGESFSSVVEKLKDGDVINYGFLFKRYAIEKKVDVALKSGTHVMSKNMGYKKAASELASYGEENNTVMITVPEGYELKEIASLVNEKIGIPEAEFLKAAEADYGMEYAKDIPERTGRLEGYLFPDTYEFYTTDSAEAIIRKMLSGFENVWTEQFEARRNELGMTVDEVIILASIIEREAGSVSEMGKVSSVFHNRLNIGMALQSCATVQYILEERKDVLSISDTKIDSPYNTYLYPGLPEGPIANPGKAAIEAAVYPEDTEYYYFKVNDDGITVFSETRAEHDAK